MLNQTPKNKMTVKKILLDHILSYLRTRSNELSPAHTLKGVQIPYFPGFNDTFSNFSLVILGFV